MKSRLWRVILWALAFTLVLMGSAQAEDDVLPPYGPLPAIQGNSINLAGGTITAGVTNEVAFYSAPTVISSNPALTFTGTELVFNEAGSAALDFRMETDNEASAVLIDSSADDVIFNDGGAATFNLRVEGDANANLIFVDGTDDQVGFGTAAPDDFVDIVGGSLASTVNALAVTGTLSTTAGTQSAVDVLATSAGAAAGGTNQNGILVGIGAGYTGTGSSNAVQAYNLTAGTGTNPFAGTGNFAGNLYTVAGGHSNVGVRAYSEGATNTDYGLMAEAVGTVRNVGAFGGAWDTAPTVIGGYFGLMDNISFNATVFSPPQAALVADNRIEAKPIFIACDNTTGVDGACLNQVVIDDGGVTTFNASGNATADVTIAGDNEPTLLFADVSADDIIMNDGGSAAFTLRIEGDTEPDLFRVDASTDDIIMNDGGAATFTLRIESDTNANAILLDGANNAIGLLDGSPAAGTITAGAQLVFNGLGATTAITATSGQDLKIATAGGGSRLILDSGGNAAGQNLRVASDANSSTDRAVDLGSNNTATTEVLLNVCTDCDGTPSNKFQIQGTGHLTSPSTASVPSGIASGTCTGETAVNTLTDVRGVIQSDCTSGQTTIVTFGTAYTTAPACVCSPENAAAATMVTVGISCSASTTALTITATNAGWTDGQVSYLCME